MHNLCKIPCRSWGVVHAPQSSAERTGCFQCSITLGNQNFAICCYFNVSLWLRFGDCSDTVFAVRVAIAILMPPAEHDLRLCTITQLVQTLLNVTLELARRFRVAVPPVPAADETPPFHCHEQCRFCTCKCFRTDPRHRTHFCHRHIGF